LRATEKVGSLYWLPLTLQLVDWIFLPSVTSLITTCPCQQPTMFIASAELVEPDVQVSLSHLFAPTSATS
jgi:hypothetical protein